MLKFAGEKATDDDEIESVIEAPTNMFIYGISQERSSGPITDV